MKRHIIFAAIVCAALMTLTSCDKVEEGKYTIFSGAAGTWFNSNENIPDTQRAFLEKYTGVRCKNCPEADEVIHAAMEKYGDRLNVASVHFNNSFGEPIKPTDPDLRTEKGNSWCDYFMGSSAALPSALLNRGRSGGSWDSFDPAAGFDDRVDAVIGNQASIGLLMNAGEEEGKPYAEVHIGFNRDITEALTLTILVIEDDIHTSQLRGREQLDDYQQNHVLRQIVTDEWGMDVVADGKTGTKRMVRVPVDLRSDCARGNCSLIAFVSYKESREIVNSVSCRLK